MNCGIDCLEHSSRAALKRTGFKRVGVRRRRHCSGSRTGESSGNLPECSGRSLAQRGALAASVA
jgi:hypothetical protein